MGDGTDPTSTSHRSPSETGPTAEAGDTNTGDTFTDGAQANPKADVPALAEAETADPALVAALTESTVSYLPVPDPRGWVVDESDEPAPLDDPRLGDVDEWGRSENIRQLVRTLYDPIYSKWFRAEWDGLEKIPTEGGALLVANHAAAIPSDAPVIMHGIEKELGRAVYGLADHLFKTMPVVGTMWARAGGVVAHPDNAYRLLREQGKLVLVFPEGSKGPGKTYGQRYRLRRFGRGGYVEIAMRAGVPIIPIAVVGAEESMPTVWKSPVLAKLTGLPYFPVTANQLVLGPLLGGVAYFPAKFKLKVLDPVTFDVPADQERYSKSRVMEESEQIREQIQAALYEMLRERRSVWFG